MHQIVSRKVKGKPESVDTAMTMVFDNRSPLNPLGLPSTVFLEDRYFISFGAFNSITGLVDATVYQSNYD